MQDWLTIRSPGTTTTVRQSASDWLDLEGFRDLSMWIQVADVTSGAEVKLTLETAPMEDESLFQTLTMQPSGTVLSSRGVYFAASRANVSTVPLSKHLRWAVSSTLGGDWNLTFRLVVALNPVVREFRASRGSDLFAIPEGMSTAVSDLAGAR